MPISIIASQTRLQQVADTFSATGSKSGSEVAEIVASLAELGNAALDTVARMAVGYPFTGDSPAQNAELLVQDLLATGLLTGLPGLVERVRAGEKPTLATKSELCDVATQMQDASLAKNVRIRDLANCLMQMPVEMVDSLSASVLGNYFLHDNLSDRAFEFATTVFAEGRGAQLHASVLALDSAWPDADSCDPVKHPSLVQQAKDSYARAPASQDPGDDRPVVSSSDLVALKKMWAADEP